MIKKNQLIVQFKAGDCAFYTSKRPGGGPSLESEGHMPFANAPNDFIPDLHKLSRDPGSLAAVARAIEDYDDSQMRVLMYLLDQSQRLRRFDLRFGQVVYKAMGNNQYVDGWFRCYVVGLGPMIENTQYVKLCGSLDNIGGTLITCPLGSFFPPSIFRQMHRQMVSEGRLTTPVDRLGRSIRHLKPESPMERLPTLAAIQSKLEAAPDAVVRSKRTPTRTTAAEARKKLANNKTGRARRGSFSVKV